jgi:hypothetical protein
LRATPGVAAVVVRSSLSEREQIKVKPRSTTVNDRGYKASSLY